MADNEFSVVQFFHDDSHEYVAQGLGPGQAVELAKRMTQSFGARYGTTRRVIITDTGDYTVFEWRFGEGVTFPPVGP